MSDRHAAGRGPRIAAALLLVLLPAVLGGCSDDDGHTGGDGTMTADGFTKPGTTLSLGDTATLPVGDDEGTMELTVKSIEAGTAADLDAIGYGGPAGTPYFVRMDVKVVGGSAPGVIQDDYLHAWAGDTPVPQVIQVKPVPPCESKTFSGMALGTTISTCATYVAQLGGEVDRVTFDNSGTESATEYRNGEHTAVTWE